MAKRPTPEQMLDLTTRLIRAKAEVKRLQQEYDECIEPVNAPLNDIPVRTLKGSATEQMIMHLKMHVGQGFTAQQIAAALGAQEKQQSIATALSKLVKQGRVAKHGTNAYQAVSAEVVERAKDLLTEGV